MLYARNILPKISAWLGSDNILVLHGSRQVGKTNILKLLQNQLEKENKPCFYIDLEDEDNLDQLNIGVEGLLKNIQTKSGIGFALYNSKWSFNYYGDSMKCREYMYFGLPVITTDTHSTVEEIREFEAGVICEQTVDSYLKAISNINDNYEKFSRNAKLLSEKYKDIHSKQLEIIM